MIKVESMKARIPPFAPARNVYIPPLKFQVSVHFTLKLPAGRDASGEPPAQLKLIAESVRVSVGLPLKVVLFQYCPVQFDPVSAVAVVNGVITHSVAAITILLITINAARLPTLKPNNRMARLSSSDH